MRLLLLLEVGGPIGVGGRVLGHVGALVARARVPHHLLPQVAQLHQPDGKGVLRLDALRDRMQAEQSTSTTVTFPLSDPPPPSPTPLP